MLIGKEKLETIRQKLNNIVTQNYYIPRDFSPGRWTYEQHQELCDFKSFLQSQTQCLMRSFIDELIDSVYTQEHMEEDLKLR